MDEGRFTKLTDADSPVSKLASAPTTNSTSQRIKRMWRKRVMPVIGGAAVIGILVGGGMVIYQAVAHPLKSNGTNEIGGGGGGMLNKQTSETGGIVNNQAVQGGGGIAGGGGVSGRSHNGPQWAHGVDNPQVVDAQVIGVIGSQLEVAYLGSAANLRLTGEALLVYGGKIREGQTVTFTVLSSKVAEAFGAGDGSVGDLGTISSITVSN